MFNDLFSNVWEDLFSIGNVFLLQLQPAMHLPRSVGRRRRVQTSCLTTKRIDQLPSRPLGGLTGSPPHFQEKLSALRPPEQSWLVQTALPFEIKDVLRKIELKGLCWAWLLYFNGLFRTCVIIKPLIPLSSCPFCPPPRPLFCVWIILIIRVTFNCSTSLSCIPLDDSLVGQLTTSTNKGKDRPLASKGRRVQLFCSSFFCTFLLSCLW